MKSKHADHQFPWTSNEDEEDLTCEINDYTLRVEQLDDRLWWWCVYYKDERLYQEYDTVSSKYRAIGLCEGTCLAHSITERIIEDGFGGSWSARCPNCKEQKMQIVRPGKVQCSECG